MPGEVDKENEKRFDNKHNVDIYEAIKKKLLKEKRESQDKPLTERQKKNIKTNITRHRKVNARKCKLL